MVMEAMAEEMNRLGGPLSSGSMDGWWLLGLVVGAALLAVGARRALTAVWTLRARALAPGLSRRLASWVRPRSYSDEDFFRADGAGEPIVARRRAGLDRLALRF